MECARRTIGSPGGLNVSADFAPRVERAECVERTEPGGLIEGRGLPLRCGSIDCPPCKDPIPPLEVGRPVWTGVVFSERFGGVAPDCMMFSLKTKWRSIVVAAPMDSETRDGLVPEPGSVCHSGTIRAMGEHA